MLQAYLASVLIFMIINLSVVSIFRDAYIKNGWVVGPRNKWYKRIYTAFLISAIPILRVFITVMLVFMACVKKEDLDKIMEEKDDN